MIKTNAKKDSDSVFILYKGTDFEKIATSVIVDNFIIKGDVIIVNTIRKDNDNVVLGLFYYEIPVSEINIAKAKDFDDVTQYIEKWLIANHLDFVGGVIA